jgi:hypothetical protein
MRTRRRLVAVLAAVLLAGSSAACAGSDAPVSPGVSVSSSESGSYSARALPPTSAGATGEMTLTGRPESGVEAGCIVLQSGDTLYLLVGGDRELLRSGRPVVVRGRLAQGLATTCQQGTPFQVAEVRPA